MMIKYRCAGYCDATKEIKKGEEVPLCCGEKMIEVGKNEFVSDMECACKSCGSCN